MSPAARLTSTLITLALSAAVSTGCAQTADTQRSKVAVSDRQTSAQPRHVTRDVRACLGAEAVLGHVAAGTARWSPERQPFSKPMATRIRLSSTQLAHEGRQARTSRIRSAVRGMARSFGSLSAAMGRRDRGEVDAAMHQTRVSYQVLKKTCSLS